MHDLATPKDNTQNKHLRLAEVQMLTDGSYLHGIMVAVSPKARVLFRPVDHRRQRPGSSCSQQRRCVAFRSFSLSVVGHFGNPKTLNPKLTLNLKP